MTASSARPLRLPLPPGGLPTLLLRLVVLTCGLEAWQLMIGVRFQIFLLLAGLFVLSFVFNPSRSLLAVTLSRPVRRYAGFLVAALALDLLSFFGVEFSNPGANALFWKVFIYDTGCTVFLLCVTLHLSQSGPNERWTMLRYFVYGGIAASLFAVACEFCALLADFDLARAIFGFISQYSADRRIGSYMEVWQFSWGHFARVCGFAGFNPQGTYSALTFLCLVFLRPLRRSSANLGFAFVALTALVFTMSRSGMMVLCVGMAAYIVIGRAPLLKKLGPLIGITVLSLLLACFYPSQIAQVVTNRFDMESVQDLGGRSEIWSYTVQWIQAKPFGNGVGQFEPLAENSTIPEDSRTDPHSSWLRILLYTGLQGFLLQLALWAWLIASSCKGKTEPGRVFASLLVGIGCGGLLNVVLTYFFVNLLVTLFVCAILLPASTTCAYTEPAAPSPAC
jgi:O-antigen ligase